jgi:hypothetical protein
MLASSNHIIFLIILIQSRTTHNAFSRQSTELQLDLKQTDLILEPYAMDKRQTISIVSINEAESLDNRLQFLIF